MNTPKPFPASNASPCGECPAGVMHLRHITYFTWLGEELITVPSFPAWICDMCGKREYDERAISWLNMLLDPNAGKPTRRVKRAPRPGTTKRNIPRPPLD
jgi:YgiT-type zinc finger domain-containing protein